MSKKRMPRMAKSQGFAMAEVPEELASWSRLDPCGKKDGGHAYSVHEHAPDPAIRQFYIEGPSDIGAQ